MKIPQEDLHMKKAPVLHTICEHSATQSDLQRCSMPTFLAREEAEGETPKEETLGDYLREYESQSRRFKEHLRFQGFCQLKEERRPRNYDRRRECMQHTLSRFFLPTIDGSRKSTTKAWVNKLDTYFQLHRVLEGEAIKVAPLHLEGKAYDWSFYETSFLNHVNVSTYASSLGG